MHNFKKHIRVFAFIAVIICLMLIVDFALVPSGYIRYIIHEVNKGDTNYDCIVLGASHGRSSIDPYKLDEAGYSKSAFNLCIPGETVEDSYYLLKESDRKNNVKKVILDIDYQYWCNFKDREFGDVFIYTQLPMSGVKLEYIKDNLLSKDFRTTFSKRWAYVSSPDAIASNIKNKLTSAYWNYDFESVEVHDAGGPYVGRGYFYRDYDLGDKGTYERFEWDESNIHQKSVMYFNKIVKYCKDNDIELTCISSPITPYTVVNGPSDKAGEYFTKLCKEAGVEYIDYNLLRLDVLERMDSDFVDWDGHMVGPLADNFSLILGETLNKINDNSTSYSEIMGQYMYTSYNILKTELTR